MSNSQTDRQGWGGETRQNQLYKPFLRGALVTVLTIGCTLGALNLAVMAFRTDLSAAWTTLIQAHAYAQIFGWVGFFIMGISYHTLPRFFLRPLSKPQLVLPSLILVAFGLVVRFFSQAAAAYTPAADWVMVLGALSGLAGETLFVWAMYDTMAHGRDKFGTPTYKLFLAAGFAWLWLASAITVLITIYLAANGLSAIPPSLDAPYLRATLSGAIVTIILGYTLRTVPQIMALRIPPTRPLQVVFGLYTLAVAAQVLNDTALIGAPGRWLAALGALIEVSALLWYVALVGLFAPSRGASQRARANPNPWPERFVRTAYFWLLFSAALNFAYSISALGGKPAPHAFIASYHHALTVGFISLMIVGMSMKLVPVFIGVMNKQARIAGTVFGLLLLGNSLRIVSESMAYLYGGIFYPLMGVSGFIEVCGLALYAVTLWRALNKPSYGQGQADRTQEKRPLEKAGSRVA